MCAARRLNERRALTLLSLAVVSWSLAACDGQSPTAGISASPETSASPIATPDSSATPPERLTLELVTGGLTEPIGISSSGDGSGRLFVNERGGLIRVIGPDGDLRGEPFVDLSDRLAAGGERGLLGVAFHPNFASNGRLFVHYSRAGDGATVVSELRASPELQTADPGSERILLTVAQPFANHNGGQLAFGPDGYLYIGLGDGGSGGDPFDNGQNPNVLLGKILRIDVDGQPDGRRAYALPPDNPYGPDGIEPGGGLPEIWALGLRNPWRFSFDPANGDLYIGDVGQSSYEEIDRQPGDSAGGENYGWNRMEGRHCYTDGCDPSGFVMPIAEYGGDSGCAVTGGYVYRGAAQPALAGIYVFADYCSGIVFTIPAGGGEETPSQALDSEVSISSFGTDEAGELYLADLAGGGIYRVLVDG
jgi:glucose/arabinose dehydrogenase